MANFSLLAKLGLNSKGFQTGLDKAKGKVGSFRKSLGGLKGALASIGFTAAVKRAADYVTEMENSARLSGLASEEFQKFAFATKTVGIEQQKAGDILKDVSDKVGDFLATGAGPMADFFEQIAPKVGVTADQFRNLNGRDALQLYVSSLEKANVSQNEMTFFLEAIASDASALLPLLKNNSKALDALANKADRVGAVIDERTVASIKNMNDSLEQTGNVAIAWGAKAFSAGQSVFTAMFEVAESLRTGNLLIGETDRKTGDWADKTDTLVRSQRTQIETQREVNRLVADAIGQTNMLLPTLDELAKLEKIVASEQKKRAKFQQEIIDKERERFINAKELEALQLRASGENAAAEALDKQITMMKEAIKIADQYGISLKEAADIVQGIEGNQPGERPDPKPEDTRGDFARELTGAELKKAANEAGKESDIRFERQGDGSFQQFVDGKKGEKFSEEQLQKGLENKIEGDKTLTTLQNIEKALQGKFVNE